MHCSSLTARVALFAILTVILAAGPAMAEKPSRGGDDKGGYQTPNGKQERHDGKGNAGHWDSRDGKGRDERGSRHTFNDQHRVSIQDYYADQYRRGHCPPGLAKKHNGCMAPGQARRWMIGQPLPRDVIFYDLPSTVLARLAPPPPRHRYVRVAQDILLLATGTGMVVDAIDNLSWEFGR